MSAGAVGFRLSHRQRQLWGLRAAGIALHAGCAVKLRDPVDPARLRAALRSVVAAHDVLRTRFALVPGASAPLQVVGDEALFDWQVVEGEAATDAAGAWAERVPRPYALADEVPLGATLLRPPGGGDRLVLGLSPLAVDAASLRILVAALARAYHGEAAGGEAAGGEVTQYLQFSEWQHELADDPAREQARAWWERAEAAASGPASPLLGGGGDGAVEQAATLTLAASLDDALGAAGGSSPPDIVCCAAWAALLGRLTGVPRVTVWAADHGRPSPELETAVGPYVRRLPVTVDLPPGARWTDVLAQVRAAFEGNARWGEWYVPDGQPGAGPAVGFTAVTEPRTDAAARLGFAIERLEVDGEPFTLELLRHPGTPARLEVRQRVAGEGRAQALVEQLHALLAAASDPGGRLHDVCLAGGRDLAVMDAANRSAPAAGDPAPLHVRFAAQAAATPDAPATAYDDETLTYAELDRRSDQLAQHLRSRGVRRGTLCAVWLEHSGDVLVALLAVLKSGGAYLPLDPRWPPARVHALLADARPRLLLTQEALLEQAGDLAGAQALCLDRDAAAIAGSPEGKATVAVDPDDLAYVMYTSGSTGAPKGVCVTHRGLANYLSWCATTYPFTSGGATLVHSPIAFDLTVTALFGPLLAGACVRFASSEGLAGLVRVLERYDDFSVVKLTPAHLRLLRQMLPRQQAAGLTHAFVVGGEALYEDDLSYWRALAPHVALFNEYGPTETVVGSVVHDASAPSGRVAVPIGRPLPATRLYVLDEGGNRVPLGVTGELHIGGAGLARGYHRRPGLTAERFVPDAFSGDAGARLYRTGDLVRYLPDGALEYVGRADDQEQVGGFRVELAEVEGALSLHPQVAEAAVAVRRDEARNARLHAYVVARGAACDPEDLRRFLQERLPEHMVPASFTALDALPLSARGKVDRARLPDPAQAARARVRVAAPRTEVEEVVTRLWEEALGFEGIGVDDNFFDLGGHSFLLLDIAFQLQEHFGVEVTPLMLLEHPTVAAIARLLAADDDAPPGSEPGPEGGERARRRRDAIERARHQRMRGEQ